MAEGNKRDTSAATQSMVSSIPLRRVYACMYIVAHRILHVLSADPPSREFTVNKAGCRSVLHAARRVPAGLAGRRSVWGRDGAMQL